MTCRDLPPDDWARPPTYTVWAGNTWRAFEDYDAASRAADGYVERGMAVQLWIGRDVAWSWEPGCASA